MTELSPFASIAPALVANGYSPIPIRPDGKMPGVLTQDGWRIMRAWSRYCDEQPGDFQIRMWSRWQSANVGVALGRGVIAFDIDREEFVEPIKAVLPTAIVAKRGRKGETLFYRADTDAIRSRGFKIDGFGVMDLISGGKQTVIPPSIHPDTFAPYHWTTPRTLADTKSAELTFVTAEHFEAVLDVLRAAGWEDEKSHPALTVGAGGDFDEDNAASEWFRQLNEDALRNLDAWVPRLGLTVCVKRGDHYRAVAEWRASNSGKPTHKRDLHVAIHPEGIVDYGDGERGYTPINLVMTCFDMTEFQLEKAAVWLGEAIGYDFTPRIILNQRPKPAGHVKPRRPGSSPVEAEPAPTEPEPDGTPSAPALPPRSPFHADEDDDDIPPETGEAWPAPLKVPAIEPVEIAGNVEAFPPPAEKPAGEPLTGDAAFEAVTHVGGLVGEIVDWMEATAQYPNRALAFAATLVFLGTLAGRLYKSPTGLRTNLYCLGIAPTGFGKDHARKCLDQIEIAGGFAAWFGGDGIASGAGMRKRVEHHASIMWKIDEFGGFMRRITDPRQAHAAQIRDYLLQYYGTAGGVFRGVDYAGEPGAPCYHPNVGIYGTTTPIDFWGAIRSLSVGDGLLPRMMIFTVGSDDMPQKVKPRFKIDNVPESLVEGCREVATPMDGGNLANLMDGSRPSKPYAVPYGPGAEDFFERAAERYRREAKRLEASEEGPFLQRLAENAAKVGLILAIGNNPKRPVLTIDCLRRGFEIVELCMTSTIGEIKGRLADNDRQREHIDVRRWIDEAGPNGIGKTELSRRINGRFDARRRDDILKTLLEDERVIESVAFQNPKGGPKGYRFVSIRYLAAAQA